ncbi:MAG TPA: phosphoribosylformylglycinamidine synthase subunit PurQ [Bacteriovoracaceae bacterium]|nr:phosphoribosylformylglycinamidine synthase subunit PurQ [Bacteriovoracaceae bacterium]
MKNVKVMVLAGEGINCENESAEAFRRLGATAEIKFVHEWQAQPKLIHDYHILVIPGGFSYGDELHSGQIMALDLKYSVNEELTDFINKKGLILGVCNGFQVLMKLGIFENHNGPRTMTLFHNESFKFQDRWVNCVAPPSKCVWTKNIQTMALPARHGEGRIIFAGTDEDQATHYNELSENSQIALFYTEDINGSYAKIAGLTDKTGQVLGLMPHPEAALESWLYPEHVTCDPTTPLQLFKNAIDHVQEHL